MRAVTERNRFLRRLALQAGVAPSLLIISSQLSSSRFVEYPWLLRNLEPVPQRILDVGSVGTALPVSLACQGYEVYCIDVRPYEYANIVPNLKSIVGDIRRTEFDEDFFDCVIAVSTIEHIGLGRYRDQIDKNGDTHAVAEIRRILKKGGDFLLTVPYGKRGVTPVHRVYDEATLSIMLDCFSPETVQYFLRADDSWRPSSQEEVRNVESLVTERAVACLKLKKPIG